MENFTHQPSQLIWGFLPILSLHREKLIAGIFVHWVLAEPGDVYQSKPPTVFLGSYAIADLSGLQEGQMPVLWGSLEELVYLMHT